MLFRPKRSPSSEPADVRPVGQKPSSIFRFLGAVDTGSAFGLTTTGRGARFGGAAGCATGGAACAAGGGAGGAAETSGWAELGGGAAIGGGGGGARTASGGAWA